MNRAINYLESLVSGAKEQLGSNYDEANTQTLIREAYKVDSVFNMMNFCSEECNINFATFAKDPEEASKTKCFNSCTTKTFEMKQIESFQRDFI